MTNLLNTFDAGTTLTDITNGNSGGANGDAFSLSGVGRQYSDDTPMHGAMCARFDVASGVSTFAQWSFTATGQLVAQIYFRLEATVSVLSPFFLLRASGNSVLQLAVDSSSRIAILNAISGNVYQTTALTLDQWYRLNVAAQHGSGSSDGILSFDYYEDDDLAVAGTGFASSAFNLGAVDFDALRFGAHGTTAVRRQFDFDTPRLVDGTSTYLAPYGANSDPTVSVTAAQSVAASASVALTATAADSDGTIASYAWAWDYPTSGAPSLTGASTATVSFTAGSAGFLGIIHCTVTDDDGATATASTEVRVPKTGTINLPAIDGTGVGTWTNLSGSATDGADLSDGSDTTAIVSPTVSGTAATRRLRLDPSTTRSDGTLTVRVDKDSAGSLVCNVLLYEGTTLRQTWSNVTVTTSIANQALSLSAPTVAAITNWANLYVEFQATS